MSNILIIDDEASILETLEMFLGEKGHRIYKAGSGKEGLARFHEFRPDLIILDIRLPDTNGLDLLKEIVQSDGLTKVIMITAYQDMDTTIRAMKDGAFDYIHKPLDADEVEKAVNSALHCLEAERNIPVRVPESMTPNKSVIIGKSEKMLEIFKMIGLLCQNRAPVLITGETGTGKELIARVIHRNSLYHEAPFVTLDCSSVVGTLLESELFGYEKGAFTGADRTRKGRIEAAGEGTLFLDEIGELPLGLQSRFLGFLQRHEYMRVGGNEVLQSKCRIIAATNRDLADMVRNGTFREDLYYRLKVVILHAPPLRERRTDIPLLANHFIHKINDELGMEVTKIQPGVIERLCAHHWLGNVRELENLLVETVVRSRGRVILLDEIEKILRTQKERTPEHAKSGFNPDESARGESPSSLPNMEREHIFKTLNQVGWNRTQAAKILKISIPTLRSKIRKYGLVE